MAPQLSAAELDFLRKLVGQGLCPVEAHTRLAARGGGVGPKPGIANTDLEQGRAWLG